MRMREGDWVHADKPLQIQKAVYNLITDEAWMVCETCGELIPTDGKCHDTKGFSSPEKSQDRMEQMGRDLARNREEAVMRAITGEKFP